MSHDIPTHMILGTLCHRGHDFDGTGKSLRYRIRGCVECLKITAKKHYANPQRKIVVAKYRETHREESRIYQQQYYQLHKKYTRARHRENYRNNKDNVLKRTAAYQRKNHDILKVFKNINMKKHRRENTSLAIGIRIRGQVYQAFRLYANGRKPMKSEKYGINYKAIVERLGPHPKTLGKSGVWHIDHIIPVAAFDLTDPEQVKIAFAPENHQWLRAKENRRKSNKILGQMNVFTQPQLAVVI